MKTITTIYKKTMKMSDLIDADYRLLILVDRLNMSLGFSEKSVEAVCKENNFDADCFLFLANFQSNKPMENIEEAFEKLPLEPFLHYLKCSHNHFLEHRLPNIRKNLEALFIADNKDLHYLVLDFFDKYTKEVLEHMSYEDNVVFPYVDALVHQKGGAIYSIEHFEDIHTDIEGKMNDLIQILMKYVSGASDRSLIIHVLYQLYMTGEDLASHRYIEDDLVIPKVKRLEQKMTRKN